MKKLLHFLCCLIIVFFTSKPLTAQSGSGWEWASTSTKATPSPGRQIRDIVTDASGNVFAVGDFAGSMTLGSTTLTTTGDGSVNNNYDFDAFVVKYDASGVVVWAKKYGIAGASNNERGEVINIDASGNVYIGGSSSTPFLIKYDNSGNLLWNKNFTLYDLGGINIDPDGNPIIMESNQSSKKIYKINPSNGSTLWTVTNTGVGSNSTTTYQDFVDQAGNIYYTAFGTGSVTVAGSNFSSSVQGTSYVASLDNNGVTRWVDQLEGAQVGLGFTIDKSGKSYVVIGGGFGGTFQGVAIGSCAACGAHYLELNSSGNLTYSANINPYNGVFRVTDDGIYASEIIASSPAVRYTAVYGDNIIRSRALALGFDIGVVAKYDLVTRKAVWANSYEVNGSNYLNTIEPTANGKCLVGGAYQTSIKFGPSLYTPTTIGSASFAFDFFIAQFNRANVLPSPTTTWTGGSNNGSWNDGGNWSNGAPNGNEKSIIPSGVSNYPLNITSANVTGKLTVGSGVSIALPVGFDVPVGIVNNGTIEVKGTGTFQGFNTSYPNILSGSGRYLFTANSPSIIFFDFATNGIEINKPGGTIQSYGGIIGGSLMLTAGVFKASNPVILTNPNATITNSATAYMTGVLKRAVNASGSYFFPMGGETQYDGGPTTYAPVTLTLTNITGPQFISVEYPGFRQSNGTAPNINLGGGKTIASFLNGNQWNISPDVALSGGSFSVTFQTSNYTNGVTDASRYVVTKRASNTTAWGFDGTNGTSTQTGGTTNGTVVSNGTVTATVTGLTSFSTFAIGIASASVPPGTAVSISNWTGNAGNTTWNDAANWDNGIPNGLINAKIPAARASYPAIYTASDNARSLQVDASATIKLPYNFIVNADIINNGTIEITGTNFVTFNGFPTLSGLGKILFTNNSPGTFSGTYNNSIEVNRTTNQLNAQNVYVGGASFNIISGNVFTNGTFITITNPNATLTATSTSHVQGYLNRAITASGTYNYPVGEGAGKYSPVTITANNIAGTTQLGVQYTSGGGSVFGSADSLPVYSLNAGTWTVTPNNAATNGTFNIAIEARGYSNGVADATKYVLFKSIGGGIYERVSNGLITENAGVISATATNQPALTVQTSYIIGVKGSTTQWTGTTNQSWTTATNWSNGVPDATKKAVFVTGSPNYPAGVASFTSAGMLDNNAGVTLKLPDNFNAQQGLANNGTIEVISTNNYPYTFNGYNKLSGTGKLLFTSLSPAGISSNSAAINNGVELNRTGNFAAGTVTINGGLTLTTGYMVGNIILTNPMAAVVYNPTSYIVGTLQRSVNTSGTYIFPIGTADRLALATMELNNLTGPQNITAAFSSTINGNVPNTTAYGVPVTQLLNAGIWTLTPNNQTTGGSYTLTLEGRSYTNGVADPLRYVVLRRDASFYDWGFYGSNGVATQNAGVVTATGTMTGFLREYGIGIANSAVTGPLPLKLVSFTATKKDAGVLLQWNTANEVNAEKIVIQYSKDASNWTAIASQPARNTMAASYIYQHSFAGSVNYYRLQFIDRDGRTTFSEIRKVSMIDVKIVKLYPNPAIGKVVTIDMGKQISTPVSYKLVDGLGRIVLAGNITHQQQSLPLSGVVIGNYYLKLSDGTALVLQVK